jgi:hypothetical protein
MKIKQMPASTVPIAWLVAGIAFSWGSSLNPFVAVDQLHNPLLRSTTTTNWFVWASFAIAGTAFIAAIWLIICGDNTFRFLIGVVSLPRCPNDRCRPLDAGQQYSFRILQTPWFEDFSERVEITPYIMDRLLGANRLSCTRSFGFRNTKESEQEELAQERSRTNQSTGPSMQRPKRKTDPLRSARDPVVNAFIDFDMIAPESVLRI